jgi:two-component system C4-dicarboxylate transport response regulator DctD
MRYERGRLASRRGEWRFIVVDDEPLIGAAFARVLSPSRVTRFTSAEDAIRELERQPPCDALITDLMLPGMNGVGLFRWLEAQCPELCRHVLFMTGSPHSALARQARGLSEFPLLVKPFSLVDVRRAVAEATGKSRLK